MAWLPGPARPAPAARRVRVGTRGRASPSTSSSSTRPTTSPRAARTRTDKVGVERRGYAVDSQRTRAVRELAERAEHRLFLSATPHNGYTESFTALLEMIDPQRFVRGTAFDEKALREVAVRRLKRDLKRSRASPNARSARSTTSRATTRPRRTNGLGSWSRAAYTLVGSPKVQ